MAHGEAYNALCQTRAQDKKRKKTQQRNNENVISAFDWLNGE